jgi:hypothetical protein
VRQPQIARRPGSLPSIKSIKELPALRKRRIAHILCPASVQSFQFWQKNGPLCEKVFQNGFIFRNYFSLPF